MLNKFFLDKEDFYDWLTHIGIMALMWVSFIAMFGSCLMLIKTCSYDWFVATLISTAVCLCVCSHKWDNYDEEELEELDKEIIQKSRP